MSSPAPAFPFLPSFLSPTSPEPDTTSTTDYAPPPPDLSSPPPPDTTGDYSPPPPDLSSPPSPDMTDAPPPPDLSSPPPPNTTGDYSPPPADLSSPPPPDDATGGDYGPPPSSPHLPEPDTSPASASASAPTPSPKVKSQPRSTYPPRPPTTTPPPLSLPISTTSSPGGWSSRSSGISTGLVVGIGIAIGSVTLVILTVVVLIWNKKRKRRPQPTPPITIRLGSKPKEDVKSFTGSLKSTPFIKYDLSCNRQQSAPAPGDHFLTIPPEHSPPPVGPAGPPRSFSSRSGSGGSGSHHSDRETPVRQTSARVAVGCSTISFTYDELSRATDGFSTANFLGKGGFGYVHKGVLPNDKEIAVKQSKTRSERGETAFQAEAEIISRVHHKNLVSLVGFCITGLERMLVYEFVQNNTLEFHLHGKGRPTMDWPTRLKIALGAARGVAYLHEDCRPRIIHRDIKASNILLDFNFEAKVADFGLAKFYPDGDTHISTLVMGTFGYVAPEYANSGKLTEKSDVFSFGVVLLELITGRLPVDTIQPCTNNSLVGWARPLLPRALEGGNFDALVDPRLQLDYKKNEMARIVACAAACVRFSAKLRPPMSQLKIYFLQD